MDLVLQSLLPSASTIHFKEAVCSIIDREDPSDIEWNKLEDLVFECAGTSSAVFREYPFLVHKILPKHPPVSVVSAVVSARPECLTLLDSYQHEGQRRVDATPLGIACRSGCSLEVIRFLIGKMVQLRSDHKLKKAFADFEKDRAGGLFATTRFDATMSVDTMRALVEEHPDGVLAMSDKVGKASLIAQIILMRPSHETLDIVQQHGFTMINWLEIDPDKYIKMFGIVLDHEISSGIPLPHAMMEVFTLTGRFKVASDDDVRKSESIIGTEAVITVHVQTGTSSHFSRDTNNTDRDRERDHFLLDKDTIVRVFQIFRNRRPGFFKEVDVYGRTLLHIALSNPKNWKHAHSRSYGYEIVQFLLEAHPEAISAKDKRGRYPLQVAIESTSPCYELILEATPPSVLESICPRTGLFLFQVPSKDSFLTEAQAALWTEISFRLLNKTPTLARGLAANPDPWIESEIFKEIQIAKMRREQETGIIVNLERRLEQLKMSYKLKGA